MPETVPSFAEFTATCRQEFAYLTEEFGFAEEALPQGKRVGTCLELPNGEFINPFAVWWRNDSLKITVQGVAWGEHAVLHLHAANGGCVGVAHVIAQKSGSVPKPLEEGGGQLQEVKRLALHFRQCCEPLLRGDQDAVVEALAIQQEAIARFIRDRDQ